MHHTSPACAARACLARFLQNVLTKRAVTDLALAPPQYFWHLVCGSATDMASIEWSKVFGSHDTNETHWTRIVPKEEIDAVRGELLAAVGMDETAWKAYRASVVDFRNQDAAHHQTLPSVEQYPQFDHAINAAQFMYGRLGQLPDAKECKCLPAEIKPWMSRVDEMVRQSVQGGFEACKSLGTLDPLAGA